MTFRLVRPPRATFLGATMASSGMFSWTPTSTQAGTSKARITVSHCSLMDSKNFTITVTPVVSQVDVKCKNPTCSVQSNSTITDAKFSRTKIRLTATGTAGTTGYANVTVPKNGSSKP